ncbi:MAG: hypothetical protein WBC33_02595 [Conexibacter sp.]
MRPTADPVRYVDFLAAAAVDDATLDLFLDPERPSWAKFDPVLGYRLANFLPRDGIGGCATISTFDADGARTARMYTDKPCRIATYGDSFTQCTQVSDGETWQEYLAAHLGEPVRNYGVGGYGVYQAYRRMLEVEAREDGSEYVILHIWGDDHTRSLMRCRHAAVYPVYDNSGTTFHVNFWSNIEMDLETGEFRERENLLATPEALRRMSDPEWMVESLRDDLAIEMVAYTRGWTSDVDLPRLRLLADRLGVSGDALAEPQPPRAAVEQLLDRYSYAATEWVLVRARAFLEQRGKQLLVCLIDPVRAMVELAAGKPRCDQQVVTFLQEGGFRHFDMNPVHAEDHKSFAIPFDDYMKRYLMGHYYPSGNHFFAFSLLPTLVDWLDPKPLTYASTDELLPDYQGYIGARDRNASV